MSNANMENFTERLKLIDERYKNNKDMLIRTFLDTSVLSVVRDYQLHSESLKDLEIWAFFCVLGDYQIDVENRYIPMLKGLMNELNKQNRKYIDLINDSKLASKILTNFYWGNNEKNQGYSHRYIKIPYLIKIHESIKKILEEYGSIGEFIKSINQEAISKKYDIPLGYILDKFSSKLLENCMDIQKSIIPSFKNGSAMKRFLLYFRWMVNSYPDLEKWKFIPSSDLLPPLDDGVIRIFQRVFNIKIYPRWNYVLRIANLLKEISPNDPIKYDFILSRPAIANYCLKDLSSSRCYICPLFGICLNSNEKSKNINRNKLSHSQEYELFTRYLQLNNDKYDQIKTDVNMGNTTVDILLHEIDNGWLVGEVEDQLSYESIGQILYYKNFVKSEKNIDAKPFIICRQFDSELKFACEIDADIKIFQV